MASGPLVDEDITECAGLWCFISDHQLPQGVTFISIYKSSAHSHLTAMKLELQNKALESLAQGKPLSSREGEREKEGYQYMRESL